MIKNVKQILLERAADCFIASMPSQDGRRRHGARQQYECLDDVIVHSVDLISK
jgi:hypothetical protein